MRRIMTAASIAALALAAGACGGRQHTAATDTGGDVTCQVARQTRIGIATGNATGVYFALGNAYAEQINAAGGRVQATAAETGASVQNIQQLVAGTYDVAFALADTAADAINGTAAFSAKQPIAALARIHTNYTQVIVRKAAGIRDVAGMRGKRVSTGSPKSGTEVIANRVLTAAGLDPARDVSAQKLDLTKTVDGMKEGTIDALFFSGGLPTPGITDLLTTARDQVEFLDITPVLPALQKINEVYRQGVIPAATYQQPADVTTIVVPNLLLVRAGLDPDVACVLTRTLFERQPQLAQANAAAREISLDTARRTSPVPLHRGAEKALDLLHAPR
ncbi:C4-dicarboxylate ABC transporter substrate-binding protein [Actinoplanes sp. SE50]|uniref:TAXI family TRAP transporter solute-binding subunit n=1 Tax=unclassified Actinoplanes TaxID=2626549 RepID=UPI00023EBF7E|nr:MULTISPECIES: TAXI family TRAP transporter solute-binding subunit [unclassified Actinoplanes]AEV86305.1 31 kDa immunogenic protein [Actinoplanes sp. SE50/110]ATO84702.1 C4-dicarboxylate ABC transporter substrate-binding protein [Actinoplanes sp. SE50]SLM02112.1 C4-dicarboxylate ABC transporter substrate-binding protein [Actinoplanes sp. SE50/110]